MVDDLFYAQHPNLKARSLTRINTPMEASLRDEWWQTADEVTADLKQISPSAQQKLGGYQLQDYQQQIQDADRLGINQVAFQNAIAARFQQLFPALVGYENGPDTSGFQLWCAIAQDELQKIKEQS
ncbi:MAG: hypothetical protein AAF289_01335 [Cyanobacteria bacterium P01_A01_bin.135]